MKRIGMLTSGGDCQSLNATMRGVVKGLNVLEGNVEIYGFIDGYKGLIYGNYKRLTSQDFSGILTTGGTILGTSRQPFKLMRTPDENGLDKVEAMKATYRYLDLDCLVILGGNGSQKTANLLREEGLNIVSLPKTIDNDLWGTDMTFGFQSAVDIATQTIDRIHTTAASHNRVFIVELMGHKVGWVTLHAGIAGGADMINDIWGLKWDERLAPLLAKEDVVCCLMHNRDNHEYKDFIEDFCSDIEETLAIAKKAGIKEERIVLDPGVGFGKNFEQNLSIMKHMDVFSRWGFPVLLGTSRKSVIGLALNLPVDQREEGTAATTVLGRMKGASIFRVHDVKTNYRELKMIEAILEAE